jgi:hypothetical protein
MTTPLGLPYAEAGVDVNGYYLTCPRCKRKIRGRDIPATVTVLGPADEATVEDTETKAAGAAYATHFEAEHAPPMLCEHRPYPGAAYHCYADAGHYRPAGHPDGADMHHDTVICWDEAGRMTNADGKPIE